MYFTGKGGKRKKSALYRMRARDIMFYGGIGYGVTALVVMIFYRSLTLSIILGTAAAAVYPLWKRKDVCERIKRKVTLEFKESLYSFSALLRAGESMETAFQTTVSEMDREQYPCLYEPWQRMAACIQLHQRLEDLLTEFAEETEIDEIMSLAQIIRISKRTKGDLVHDIDQTAELLKQKIEMQQELEVLLAKKKAEQSIMNLMPLIVIGMLTMLAPDYVEPLYTTLTGRMVMTVCALMIICSLALSRKFSDISM